MSTQEYPDVAQRSAEEHDEIGEKMQVTKKAQRNKCEVVVNEGCLG